MFSNWDALQLSQYNQKLYYDKTRRHEEFKVGDMVYLSTKRYKDYGSITYASKQTATVFGPRLRDLELALWKRRVHTS